MSIRKISALLFLCFAAALPFLGSCNSTTTVNNPPVCAVAPTSIDFGNVSVGTTAQRTFAVKNTGGGTLTGAVTVGCSQYSLVGSGAYSVAGGDSALITVRFSPASTGIKLCSVFTGCDSVHLTGAGVISATPVCAVSLGTVTFPTVTVGQTKDTTFTITNLGGGTLAGTVTTGGCAGYSIQGDATFSLGTNQTKAITVRYAPTAAGTQSCTINTGTSCSGVTVTGTGQAAPSCQVSTTTLDFGSVTVGQNSDKTFSITNSGGGSLTGTVSTSGCTGFAIVGEASYSLGAGISKTFTVRFTPATAGKPSKSLAWGRPGDSRVRLLSSDLQTCTVNTGCASISASGTGVAASACHVEPASLLFGDVAVGQHSDKTFTLTNNGGGTLTGTVATGGCAAFSIQGDATYTLAASQSKVFTVRFAPTAAGAQNCNVNAGTGCSTVSASGSGQLAAACQVNTTNLAFGSVNVGQSADRTFTITNTGGGTLTGTVATGGCAGFSVVGDANYSLGAGISKTFTIRFAPTSAGKPGQAQLMSRLRRWLGRPLETGVQTCTVTTGCTATLSATGTGVSGPACAVLPTTLSYGSVAVNQSADRTFTITNNGGSTLSGTVTLSCANFSIIGSPTYSLTAGQSATITIRYAPTSTGTQSCNISTGGSCSAVSASGTGVPLTGCNITVGPSFYGTWLQVDSTYKCDGSLQNVTRDTLVICSRYGASDTIPADTSTGLNFNCAITQCTGSQFREECNGSFAPDTGCSVAINYIISESYNSNSVNGVITTHTTYTGNCFGLANGCTITGVHLTKLNSDTTNCGKASTGSGGTLSMSCKVNGAQWAADYAIGNIHGQGGANIVTLFGSRTSDESSLDLVVNTTASVTAATYNSTSGLTMEYIHGTDIFLGDAASQMTISSINGSAKTIAGTFQGTATPLISGSNVSITDGTFSGNFTTSGAPTIGSPRWVLHQMIRPKR